MTAAHGSQVDRHGGSVLHRLWKALARDGRAAPSDETEPVSIEELVEDETIRLLESAGVPTGDYDLHLVVPGHDTVRGADEWLVFVQLRRWREGTDCILLGLERKLQRRMESVGIPVRAVYWRVLPEARANWPMKPACRFSGTG